MLNSIDLFSGIGGISYGLRGLVKPVAYCEIDLFCKTILEANILSRRLHKAPVFSDVRKLRKHDLPPHTSIDVITAGFPCVGFSNLGLREGFGNSQSSLFSEVLRLIDDLKPSFVFLENVPTIIGLGLKDIIKQMVCRGYGLRWCVVSASDLGAFHMRRRWFCLCIKNSARALPHEWITAKHKPQFEWKESVAPRRMVSNKCALQKKRSAALGNAVVPDAARYALIYLAKANLVKAGIAKLPKHGFVLPGDHHVYSLEPPPVVRRAPHLKLVFNNRFFGKHQTKPSSKLLSTKIVTEDYVRDSWSTPRHGNIGACNFLTERSLKDLPTQVRFEKGTPESDRKGCLSGDFVDWLMGYPAGWTAP